MYKQTVHNVIHAEVCTALCICPRVAGCGGVEHADVKCVEHGRNVAIVPIHSHPRALPQSA